MAKSDIQSQVILAVVTGAIITVEEAGIAEGELPAILYAREVGDKAFRQWPETGNPKKNLLACTNHCKNLAEKLDKASDEHSPLVLISLSQLLLTDLMERVKNKKKLRILEPLREAVDGIHNLLDPKGQHYDVFEYAEELARAVKNEIEF